MQGVSITTLVTHMVNCECGAVLPPNATAKQLKQHLKSITHKRFLQQAALAKPAAGATAAAAKDADAAAATVDRQDDDSELHALRELCGPDAPDALLQPYAVNRQRYRMLISACRSSAALLPPPVLRNPRKECPALDRPFLTAQCGTIPSVPADLDAALRTYFTGRRDAHPRVDVEGADQDVVGSWSEARRALQAAAAAGRRFWCTFYLPGMGHPSWWPKACKGPDGTGEGPGSAPTQDQVIVGRGRTGIGIHADKYDVGGDLGRRKLCSTCITIVKGRKHVLMLPPSCAAGSCDSCSWFGDGDDFPLSPSPELLRRLVAAGGYLFSMEPLTPWRADADDENGDEVEGLALFTPAGWFHWLVGDAPANSHDDWHVVFGGSYPPPGGPVTA